MLQNGTSSQRKQVEVIRGSGSEVVVTRGLEDGQTIALPDEIDKGPGAI